MGKWSNVTSGTAGGGFVDEEGIYNVIVEKGWDSLMAPEGTRDKEKGGGKHYLGLMTKVVGPEGNPQMNRLFTIRLWVHTKKTQENTKGVLERMGMEFDENLRAEDPMSVEEIVGQYAKVQIERERIPLKEGETEQRYSFKVAPWNIFEPDPEFENHPRQLFIDKENKMSVEHYKAELERMQEAFSDNDNDLPF